MCPLLVYHPIHYSVILSRPGSWVWVLSPNFDIQKPITEFPTTVSSSVIRSYSSDSILSRLGLLPLSKWLIDDEACIMPPNETNWEIINTSPTCYIIVLPSSLKYRYSWEDKHTITYIFKIEQIISWCTRLWTTGNKWITGLKKMEESFIVFSNFTVFTVLPDNSGTLFLFSSLFFKFSTSTYGRILLEAPGLPFNLKNEEKAIQ